MTPKARCLFVTARSSLCLRDCEGILKKLLVISSSDVLSSSTTTCHCRCHMHRHYRAPNNDHDGREPGGCVSYSRWLQRQQQTAFSTVSGSKTSVPVISCNSYVYYSMSPYFKRAKLPDHVSDIAQGNLQTIAESTDVFDDLITKLHQRKSRQFHLANQMHHDKGHYSDELSALLQSDQIQTAMELFRKKSADSVYPSFDTIQKLVSCQAKLGQLYEIDFINSVCKAVYPAKHQHMLSFLQYKAEAYGHTGKYKESMDMFGHLYKEYPIKRGKIANLSKFVMKEIVKVSKEYGNKVMDSDDPLTHAVAFVELCATYGGLRPASNLWKILILSNHPAHHELAENLAEKLGDLPAAIAGKMKPLCEEVVALNRPDVLYRLVNTVEKWGLEEQKPVIFNCLMQVYCKFAIDLLNINHKKKESFGLDLKFWYIH